MCSYQLNILIDIVDKLVCFWICFFIVSRGGGRLGRNPGGSAIPGRPVAKAEQAPGTSPVFQKSV